MLTKGGNFSPLFLYQQIENSEFRSLIFTFQPLYG